jgi:hypothetical protein
VNLRHLDLQDNSVVSLAPLAGLVNLEELILEMNNSLTNLSGLESLTALRALYLDYAFPADTVIDFTPLFVLTNLHTLLMRHCGVTDADLARFVVFTQMTGLELGGNNITDLSPLAALTNLEALGLSYNDVSDLMPLAALTKLRSLEMHGNSQITSPKVRELEAALPDLEVYHSSRRNVMTGTVPVEQYEPYRESKHFVFNVPAELFNTKVHPEDLGWWLSQMDILYEAMHEFVGWHPGSPGQKIRMNYDAGLGTGTTEGVLMNAVRGGASMNFSPKAVTNWASYVINERVYWSPVHELGHNFGDYPQFNVEFTGDFLVTYASIVTGIPMHDNRTRQRTNQSLNTWYEAEYRWQAMSEAERDRLKGNSEIHNTRYTSIISCAILDYVRDFGWDAVAQTFRSYRNGRAIADYPYTGTNVRNTGDRRSVRMYDFFDRLHYYSGVDFWTTYLAHDDWAAYLRGEFPGVTTVATPLIPRVTVEQPSLLRIAVVYTGSFARVELRNNSDTAITTRGMTFTDGGEFSVRMPALIIRGGESATLYGSSNNSLSPRPVVKGGQLGLRVETANLLQLVGSDGGVVAAWVA